MVSSVDINFTKGALVGLQCPASGVITYRDSKEKGLSLYVTKAGHKSFFVRRRCNGKDERFILGNFPTMTVEQARKAAQQIKGCLSQGLNPNAEKNKLANDITFGDGFKMFMERYSKLEKKSWKYDEREVNKFLSHWFKRKMSSITKSEVQALHEKIGKENGKYQANRILERIRAIYNKLMSWEWEGENPTNGIKKFREKKRDRFIMTDEFPKFIKALDEEENQTARDYFWMCLLTGARKSNVLTMKWCEIDYNLKTWRIPDTKNGDPVYVPLLDNALEILRSRNNEHADSKYVFQSSASKTGHFVEPQKAWERILQRAGIENLRIHDLRRTMGSYQAITGSSMAIIGKSLGHKSQQATQIYARLSNDPVRASMEKATEKMRGMSVKC